MLSIQLECRACGWWTVCGEAEVVRRLRQLGLFRRAPNPPAELVQELVRSHGPRLACDRCGNLGLLLKEGDGAAGGDWEQAVTCEICRTPIPPERLANVPAARRCVACQGAADRGEAFIDPDYCPKCGSIVELRVSRASGTTRYKLFCTGNPPCRL